MKAENIIFGPILFKCEVEQDSINKLKSLCSQDKKKVDRQHMQPNPA